MTELLVILMCLALNALLSAFEMAFVSIGKPELRQLVKNGEGRAKRLLQLRENPERTLSVLQVGITLVGAISAAVGGAGAEEWLSPHFQQVFSVSEETSEAIAIGVIVIPLTYFSVVLGELIPKAIAMRDPHRIALRGALFISFADRFFHPIVTLLEKSTQFVLMLIPGLKTRQAAEDQSIHLDELPSSQREFVMNVLKTERVKISEVMVPWNQVDVIRDSLPAAEVLNAIAAKGHTRWPVINDKGEVAGVLNSKEFLALTQTGSSAWTSLIRDAVRIDANEQILKALRLLQATNRHLALVFDRSRVIGIVTLEDIVEEIVGDIRDEDDDGVVRSLLASRLRRR